MHELTIEMAKDMPFIDCVKYFKPKWSEDQCDFYLWEHTYFPFSTKETIIKQLNEQLLQ